MTPTITSDVARDTFAGCAPFYDALTAHHNYQGLTDTLEQILDSNGHPGMRMLDVACGTGKSALEFARRGYDVTACDISPEMLVWARNKCDSSVELFEADMRSLPELDEFDLITCIDEPVNYLLETDEVSTSFRSMARNLRPGGLLLFDLNTLHTFRTIFGGQESYEQAGWFFVWRGHGDGSAEPGELSGFTIEAFEESEPGLWRRTTNDHRERHYPPALILELLEDAGLACAAVYGMTMDGELHSPPDENAHTKFFYLARKHATE